MIARATSRDAAGSLTCRSGDDLRTVLAPDRQRVDGTAGAGAKERLARHSLRSGENDDVLLVERKRLGRLLHAIAEADAQRTIDSDAESRDDALVELGQLHPREPYVPPRALHDIRRDLGDDVH